MSDGKDTTTRAAPAPHAGFSGRSPSLDGPPVRDYVKEEPGWASPAKVPGRDGSIYQGLVTQMLFVQPTARYALAVTSAMSGEGVTWTSAEVAVALAQRTSKTVLLVDANLRRPGLHRVFGLDPGNGLEQLILGTGPGRASRTELPNLGVMTAGAPASNPSRLMTSPRLKAAIVGLRAQFDFLVFDCPPVLEDVDAAQLCRLVDGVALVVRAGVTPREEVIRSRERLEGANVVGVILSRA